MAYEDALLQIGEFGRYQRIKLLLTCLTTFLTGFTLMSGVFLGAVPNFRCLLPDEVKENATYKLSSNVSSEFYPWDKQRGGWSQCKMYDLDGDPSLTDSTVKCDSYVYDESIYKRTITSDFDLVCDNSWLKTTSDSLFMVGVMIGAMIFGASSDKWGRKPSYYAAIVSYLLGSILVLISPEFVSYTIARIVVGAACSGIFMVGYVNVLEIIGTKHRRVIVAGIHVSYSLGYATLIVCAYFIRTWRHLQITMILPAVGFLSYWWFISESIRWLQSKGRRKQAIDLLHAVSTANGADETRDAINGLLGETADSKSDVEKATILDVLTKYPNLRKKSFVLFFCWFINSGTYYGLSWNTSNLVGDSYLNALISALVEIPAHGLVYFTLNRWGRKFVLVSCMLIAGTSLLVATIIPNSMQWLVIVFSMIGKLAITASYESIYLFTAEQYPTVIRNVGVGACSTVARIGGILAPFINYSSTVWPHLPRLIFGSGALIAGLLTIILPETLNMDLPQTMEDGEQFGKKSRKLKQSSDS
ncbi:organic cation transporter protein-like [Athalia rosae]|uniref:organic cation transporter protein-like n=1 Tax=Athalia rosae TaxID=37344 RepID=UPI002033B596|nr:organic cation transporter protein-like [Athalia rosae]